MKVSTTAKSTKQSAVKLSQVEKEKLADIIKRAKSNASK
jgi:hypothetical protein